MKKALIILCILVCTVTLNVSFAAEEYAATNEHAAAEEHHQTIPQIIGPWVNFLVLIGLLYYFFKNKMHVQDRFKADYEKIQGSIESARIAKEEAELRLKELDRKLDQLNDEIVGLKAAAAREADEEKKKSWKRHKKKQNELWNKRIGTLIPRLKMRAKSSANNLLIQL